MAAVYRNLSISEHSTQLREAVIDFDNRHDVQSCRQKDVRPMRNPKRNAVLGIYQLVLAIFLFVSPWLFAFAHGTLRIDTWVSAAIVAVISLLALIAFRDWKEWIACIVGLWIAVSPWVLGFQHTRAMFIKSGRRPFNCVPRAARALADPLRFVSRKGIGLAIAHPGNRLRHRCLQTELSALGHKRT